MSLRCGALPGRSARTADRRALQLFDLPFTLGPFHLEVVSLTQRQRDAALGYTKEQA